MTKRKYKDNGFPVIPDPYGNPSREIYNPDADIGLGAWVLITHKLNVQNGPIPYAIYWATPYISKHRVGHPAKTKTLQNVDEYGRQCAMIHTPHSVKIFPDEYTILSEQKLQTYRENGWELHETMINAEIPLNQELLEKGRTLCEEERECIWALMLDGLSEQQACEEYFLTKHSQNNNINFHYRLSPDLQNKIENIFG